MHRHQYCRFFGSRLVGGSRSRLSPIFVYEVRSYRVTEVPRCEGTRRDTQDCPSHSTPFSRSWPSPRVCVCVWCVCPQQYLLAAHRRPAAALSSRPSTTSLLAPPAELALHIAPPFPCSGTDRHLDARQSPRSTNPGPQNGARPHRRTQRRRRCQLTRPPPIKRRHPACRSPPRRHYRSQATRCSILDCISAGP